jgi:hypothetical protein
MKMFTSISLVNNCSTQHHHHDHNHNTFNTCNNIWRNLGFGSWFELLFKEGSRPYNEETLRLAEEHVRGLEADLGGTEILQPLMAIFETPTNLPRQIILLTDGKNLYISFLFILL